MPSLGKRTTETAMMQAVESIRAVGEMMRYTPDHKAGYAAALHVEQLARILVTALTELDARLSKLEAGKGSEFETCKPEASNERV